MRGKELSLCTYSKCLLRRTVNAWKFHVMRIDWQDDICSTIADYSSRPAEGQALGSRGNLQNSSFCAGANSCGDPKRPPRDELPQLLRPVVCRL